jgi:DUF4097 and DUF4098 domain-containing protein YvlB
MAGYPPPYPPPGPPYGPPSPQDLKYQRRILRDQARAQRVQYRYQMRGMRRRSIVGPVFVILIGVVFLLVQAGRLHGDQLWMWYGRWWPLILVVVGVVLLIEWGIDQVRPRDPQQPYLRRSIGGGVISLIVLLTVAGVFLNGVHDRHNFLAHRLSLNPDNLEEFFGDKHESDESRVEAFPAGSNLSIDNPRGDVTITGISNDSQVHLSIHKQVYSHSDSDAESTARKLTPQIDNSGKLFAITLPSMSGAIADVTMTVPATAGITINANHGNVRVDSFNSPVTVTANHGDIDLSVITGAVVAHVNNSGSSFSAQNITGPLSVEGHGQNLTVSNITGAVTLSGDFYGTTHLEHITSGIKFHTSRTDFQLARLDGEMEISPDAALSVDQAVGPVVLSTRNHNITLERISGDLSVTNRNGSVDLTSAPPLGNVTVQNRNGSVNLTLPDKATFTVSAETSDGDMENDFSLPTQQNDSRKTLNGTVGKGGALIRINTTQGDVSVRKASIAPLPPTPPRPPAAPQISINGDDGSSVYVGKDGVRITSGSNGDSVILGNDGLRIAGKADGSSIYKGTDGTKLTQNADGSKIFVGHDGTHYTEGVDGSKSYNGPDGTSITISASGSQTAKGPGGRSLSDSEIRDRLKHAEEDLHRAEHQRDAERHNHHSED